MDTYNNIVGRCAQLIFELAPDRTEGIPTADAARLAEFGAKLKSVHGKDLARNHEPIHTNAEPALDGNPDALWSPAMNGSVPTLTVSMSSRRDSIVR